MCLLVIENIKINFDNLKDLFQCFSIYNSNI